VIKTIEVRNNSTAASQPGDLASDVSVPGYAKTLGDAGAKGRALDLVVLRDGKPVEIKDVHATISLGKDRDGTERKDIGASVGYDEATPVIAAVAKDSPAAKVEGGLPAGALITRIDGRPVKTWFDVRDALSGDVASTHKLTLLERADDPTAKPIERALTLAKADAERVGRIRVGINYMFLGEEIVVRQTGSPLTAMKWGVAETRDLILQFYVTLQRMFGGSISASNLMGPVGIFGAGAQFAFRGADWLLWFLAMISANLAVVNFLPIPIVDGGLFLFLIIEKIMGRPLSRRAQEIAQYAGLVLILSVFVMVTYNDIARFFN
jgi:regulator of sigma E protease